MNLKYYFGFIFLLSLISCNVNLKADKNSCIKFEGFEAHALGQIDDTKYTNCKEAFELSYSKGYKIFETDISLTADDEIVLMHDLNTFNANNGIKVFVFTVDDNDTVEKLKKYGVSGVCTNNLTNW